MKKGFHLSKKTVTGLAALQRSQRAKSDIFFQEDNEREKTEVEVFIDVEEKRREEKPDKNT